MVERNTYLVNTCRSCGETFRRHCDIVPETLQHEDCCWDCSVMRLVGHVCDCVIFSQPKRLIGVVGTAERFAIVARPIGSVYWYGLTCGGRVEALNPDTEFHMVAAEDLPEVSVM